VFYNGIEGYVIRVGKKDKDGNTIHDIMIYDHSRHMGNNSMTTAEWGKMELTPDKRFLIFRLFNGTNYEERIDLRDNEVNRPFQRTQFHEQSQLFDLSAFSLTRTDENLFKKNYEMQNIRQLTHSIDSIQTQLLLEKQSFAKSFMENLTFYRNLDSTKRKMADTLPKFKPDVITNFKVKERFTILGTARNSAIAARQNLGYSKDNLYAKEKLIHKHQIVYHKKFSFSMACFLLFFIGAPLGAIIRKGGLGMPAVISTLFFILFWIMSFIGEKYAAEGEIPAWQGMWIASAVLMPIGIFLTYKATNDASLFDIDAWTRFIKKLIPFPREQRL